MVAVIVILVTMLAAMAADRPLHDGSNPAPLDIQRVHRADGTVCPRELVRGGTECAEATTEIRP